MPLWGPQNRSGNMTEESKGKSPTQAGEIYVLFSFITVFTSPAVYFFLPEVSAGWSGIFGGADVLLCRLEATL